MNEHLKQGHPTWQLIKLHKPHIVNLLETKHSNENVPTAVGYTVVHYPRSKTTQGQVTLIAEDVSIGKYQTLVNPSKHHIQVCLPDLKLAVLAMYLPAKRAYRGKALADVMAVNRALQKAHFETVIAGDWNIPHPTLGKKKGDLRTQLKNQLKLSGLKAIDITASDNGALISWRRKYTQRKQRINAKCAKPVTTMQSSLIDYVSASPDAQKHVTDCTILKEELESDHYPTLLRMEYDIERDQKNVFEAPYILSLKHHKLPQTAEKMKQCKQELLNSMARIQNDTSLDDKTKVKQMLEQFTTASNYALLMSGALTPFFPKPIGKEKPKAISYRYPKARQLRCFIEHHVQNPTADVNVDEWNTLIEGLNRDIHVQQLKTLLQTTTDVERKAANKFKPKYFWDVINPMRKHEPLLKDNTGMIDPRPEAQLRIAVNFYRQLFNQHHQAPSIFNFMARPIDMKAKPCTVREVLRVAKQKRFTAPGIDGIPMRALLTVATEVPEAIARIMDACLQAGCYTEEMILLRISCIPKVTNATEMKQMRPISVANALLNFLDSIISNRMAEQMEPKLHRHICGLRKKRSIADPLFYVRANLLWAIVDKKPLICSMTDVSKYYDSIRHDTAENEWFELMGDSAEARLLLNMMRYSKYVVRYRGLTSEPQTRSNGIAQGAPSSCLFPKLCFNSLIWSLQHKQWGVDNGIGFVAALSYVDDNANLAADIATMLLQYELTKQHMQKWGLKFNEDKHVIYYYDPTEKVPGESAMYAELKQHFPHAKVLKTDDGEMCRYLGWWTKGAEISCETQHMKLMNRTKQRKSALNASILARGHPAPLTAMRLWTQVLRPTLLCTAEVQYRDDKQMKQMDALQHQFIAQSLQVPQTTSRAVLFAMLGTIPTTAMAEYKQLNWYLCRVFAGDREPELHAMQYSLVAEYGRLYRKFFDKLGKRNLCRPYKYTVTEMNLRTLRKYDQHSVINCVQNQFARQYNSKKLAGGFGDWKSVSNLPKTAARDGILSGLREAKAPIAPYLLHTMNKAWREWQIFTERYPLRRVFAATHKDLSDEQITIKYAQGTKVPYMVTAIEQLLQNEWLDEPKAAITSRAFFNLLTGCANWWYRKPTTAGICPICNDRWNRRGAHHILYTCTGMTQHRPAAAQAVQIDNVTMLERDRWTWQPHDGFIIQGYTARSLWDFAATLYDHAELFLIAVQREEDVEEAMLLDAQGQL